MNAMVLERVGMYWNMVFFARGLGYLSGAKVSSNSP
jgi:hypothetical protein